jgi:putative spermidine/putrescine transport system substrate-binding protein
MSDLLPAARRMRGITTVLGRAGRLLLVGIGVVLSYPDESRGEETLRIATWGGAYGQSQESAYFRPFTAETGIGIQTEFYDGSTAAIKQALSSSTTPIDVVDLSRASLETLCSEGQLESLPLSALAAGPQGRSAGDDYLPGGISTCGVASVAWSAAVAFDRQALKAGPASISDLFDTKRFPGYRALPKSARYTLEFALLADKVAPADIYRELGTPEGADRAFAALDKIKGQILWWSNAQDPIAWLVQKKVAMATGYAGRLFRAVVGARQLDILWDGQIYDIDHWAIPKTAKNKEGAQRFVAFASAPARMAAQAALIAYGPMRRSAIDLVGKHPAIGVEMKRYLPTAPDNFKNALQFDAAWWASHGQALEQRFSDWLAKTTAEAAEKSETGSVPAKPQAPAARPANPQPRSSPARRAPRPAEDEGL